MVLNEAHLDVLRHVKLNQQNTVDREGQHEIPRVFLALRQAEVPSEEFIAHTLQSCSDVS